MPVLDGTQAADDGLSDARSLAASMRGGGGPEEKKASNEESEEAVRILTFSRVGSLRRESILRQGMADLELPEFDPLEDAIRALEVIRGGGRDSPSTHSENQAKTPVGFQPIPGMISPTGMMSPPPPMLMPTPVQGNPQQLNQLMLQMPQGAAGGGTEAQPAMAFTYVPVPVYNMSGVSLPGVAPPHSGTVSPIKTAAAEDKPDGAKKQSEDSSDQVQQQQMYQQAFLQNAVAQNMQVRES